MFRLFFHAVLSCFVLGSAQTTSCKGGQGRCLSPSACGDGTLYSGLCPSFCSDILYLDPACKTSECANERMFFGRMLADISSAGGNSVRFWLLGDGSILPVNNYQSRMVTKIYTTQVSSVKWLLEENGLAPLPLANSINGYLPKILEALKGGKVRDNMPFRGTAVPS